MLPSAQSNSLKSNLSVSDEVKHTFICSLLDYHNALYTSISQSFFHKLKLVQNAQKQYEHITPVLAGCQFHYVWILKILLITFKELNGRTPKIY